MEWITSSNGVDPITSFQDIDKIKKELKLKPRHLLLFTVGINGPMMVKNLLKLKASDLMEKEINARIVLDRTHNAGSFVYNTEIDRIFKFYTNAYCPNSGDYLFKKENSSDPIDRTYLAHLVKTWTKKCNIKGNFGSSSLRKTFGYIQRTCYGVGMSELSAMYNHQSVNITLKYLKITDRSQFDLSPI